jgi:hypothetical protein
MGHQTGDGCWPEYGAGLKVWSLIGWKTVHSTDAGPDEPASLTWSTVDPYEIQQLFSGISGQETLNFAVTPSAPNGCGTEYGSIATDYVEVIVRYRLPAE